MRVYEAQGGYLREDLPAPSVPSAKENRWHSLLLANQHFFAFSASFCPFMLLDPFPARLLKASDKNVNP